MSEKSDKSIIRRVIKQGQGYASPNEGSRCVIDIKGMTSQDNKVFDEREGVEFELGEGDRVHVIEGIETALYKMKLVNLI